MPTLGFVHEPRTTLAAARAVDAALLARAPAQGHGWLHVAAIEGDVVSLGRHHPSPPPVDRCDVVVERRRTGGRVLAGGTGFLHVALVLPHRAALVADDPRALAPDQVLNRVVRGVLGALQQLGVEPSYPGRDVVTVGGRPVADLAFTVMESGATLIEVVLAWERDQSVLPHLLERVDPGGVVRATLLLPGDATSLAVACGHAPSAEELVTVLRRGYEQRLGVRMVDEALDVAALPPAPVSSARPPFAELDRRATAATMLGAMEVRLRLGVDGRLAEVRLLGDLLDAEGTVERLEQAFVGLLPTPQAIDAAIANVLEPPDAFLLGVHPLVVLRDAVLRAAA
jgi:lipoate-protein ligase A